jgi:hypothetical protein
MLLLSCCACGDDDQGAVEPGVTHGARDGGDATRDAASSNDDDREPTGDEPGSGGEAGQGDTRADAGEADEGAGSGSDSTAEDAATPPPETADAGGDQEPSDAAVATDAGVVVTDCDSLSDCCGQLRERQQAACDRVVEDGDDQSCIAYARRACGVEVDAGPPASTCEAVAECCTDLEGNDQTACEAAASLPEGRACDRAVETYCQ